MAEKLLALLVSDAAVDEHEPVGEFHQQRPHGPRAQIQGVGWIGSRPQLLWDHAKHGAPVKLEIPRVDGVQLHE